MYAFCFGGGEIAFKFKLLPPEVGSHCNESVLQFRYAQTTHLTPVSMKIKGKYRRALWLSMFILGHSSEYSGPDLPKYECLFSFSGGGMGLTKICTGCLILLTVVIPMKDKDTLTTFLNDGTSYINCLNNIFHSKYAASFPNESSQVQVSKIRHIYPEPNETLIFLPCYEGCDTGTSKCQTWIFDFKMYFPMSSYSHKLGLRQLEGSLCSPSPLLSVPKAKNRTAQTPNIPMLAEA